jgi:hypothetical protein
MRVQGHHEGTASRRLRQPFTGEKTSHVSGFARLLWFSGVAGHCRGRRSERHDAAGAAAFFTVVSLTVRRLPWGFPAERLHSRR